MLIGKSNPNSVCADKLVFLLTGNLRFEIKVTIMTIGWIKVLEIVDFEKRHTNRE